MKKIHFVSPFYPYRGGIAQFSDALIKQLQKSNVVFKINYKRLYPSFLFPGKTQFVDNEKAQNKPIEIGLDSLNPFSIFGLTSQIKKESGKNIVMNVYWMSFFAPVLTLLNFFIPKRIKKITLVHNLIPHEPRFYDSILTRCFLNTQDAFVVMSEKVKDDILRLKPKAKILRLFHPLYEHFGEKVNKLNAREKYGISSEKKVALFFGLIRDYKGLDILLHSFQLLDEEYILLIAGECYGGFEKYQKIIDQYNIANRIIHLDYFISDDEVPFLFSSADVCVLPYKNATQSGVTATALHFQLPIVCSNVGGLSEYVINGENGVLVNPNNSVELSKALISACEPKMNENMVQRAKQLKDSFSWTKFTFEFNSFIDSLY